MIALSLETSVGDIAADLPGAAEVFRRHGISFCCSGKLPLAEAARNAGHTPDTLLAELGSLRDAADRTAPTETVALIEHILVRYHETHRAELDWLVPLAQKVERVHGDHDEAPLGLTDVLLELQEELTSHMMKEEQILFPMMKNGGHPMIGHPIAAMRHEHHSATDLLRGIEHVTRGLALPEGACRSWTALYTGLQKFADDLVMHIHLENDILFPRFENAAN